MDISQISKPCDGSPRLLGIPSPIMPPSLLSPNSPHDHAKREESKTHKHHVVCCLPMLPAGSAASGLYYVPLNEAAHTVSAEASSITNASATVSSAVVDEENAEI